MSDKPSKPQEQPSPQQLDERLSQMREGAGLEESRVNREFIDQFRRYGVPLLLVVFLGIGAWGGWQRLRAMQAEGADVAMVEFRSTADAGNPENLLSIADEYRSVGSLRHQARIAAADLFLAAYRTGVRPGADPLPDDPFAFDEDDMLTSEERSRMLNRASDLYRDVAADTARRRELLPFHVQALFGSAAVAESLGDLATASSTYNEIVSIADRAGRNDWKKIAMSFRESIDALNEPMTLPARSAVADLAGSVRLEPVAPTTAGPLGQQRPPMITDSAGNPIQLQPLSPDELPPELRPAPTPPETPEPDENP